MFFLIREHTLGNDFFYFDKSSENFMLLKIACQATDCVLILAEIAVGYIFHDQFELLIPDHSLFVSTVMGFSSSYLNLTLYVTAKIVVA